MKWKYIILLSIFFIGALSKLALANNFTNKEEFNCTKVVVLTDKSAVEVLSLHNTSNIKTVIVVNGEQKSESELFPGYDALIISGVIVLSFLFTYLVSRD